MVQSEKNQNWLLCFDADDTLWENEAFFRRAEEAFSQELKDIIDPAVLRDALLQMEKQNIDKYGFGIKSFLLSKIETALDLVPADQTARVISRILHEGDALLSHPVELLDGVEEALHTIPANCTPIIITKGDLKDQWRKIDASNLAQLFADIHVVIDKTIETYANIAKRHGMQPDQMIMIGNAMKSDILPVIDLGGHAIFVPHTLMWGYEEASAPQNHPNYYETATLLDAMACVDKIIERETPQKVAVE